MEAFALYLFKSVVWLTGFALVYLLFLRNERYFLLNRIYLIAGVVASILFPFFTWHYTILIPLIPSMEVSDLQLASSYQTSPMVYTSEPFPSKELLLYLVRGNLLVKLNKNSEAVKCYEKAIALKPDFMDAYFNLGNIYYNQGVKQTEIANAIPGNEPTRYDAEKAKSDEEFKKALPFLEKAYAINDSDRLTLESLKNIYYRLQMLDKHAAVVEKIKSVQ